MEWSCISEIKSGYIVLEVGFGTGQTLIESAMRTGKDGMLGFALRLASY